MLDPGAAASAAGKLTGRAREKLLADAAGRRLNVVSGLIELNRGRPVGDVESLVLDTAMRTLDEQRAPGEATLWHLVRLLDDGSPELTDVTLSRGDEAAYRSAVAPLLGSVMALTRDALGETFSGKTTVELDLSRPLCVDISGIPETVSKS